MALNAWNKILSFLRNFKITSDGSIRGDERPTPLPGRGGKLVTDLLGTSSSDGSSGLYGALTNWLNAMSGAHLTQAEIEGNEMQMQNAEDIYQRQVTGMQKAGLNPALMYQSGAISAPSVSTQAPGASMSDLMQLFMLKPQLENIRSQSQLYRSQGQAALMQGEAALRNAGSSERNADTAEFNAATERMRVGLEKLRTDANLSLTDAEVSNYAAKTAQIYLEMMVLPLRLAIAEKHASAAEKSAIASLRNAEAAIQNAATNDRLADYQTSLMYAQELVNWANGEGQSIINKYLDDKQKAEIASLKGKTELMNKQGHLVNAQMVKTYVNCATDVSGAINQWINPLSKGPGSSSTPGFDLSGAYQGVAYGYD